MTLAYVIKSGHDLASAMIAAFPPDFQWGAATSSFQIEGATHEDGRGLSIWDRFAKRPGAVYQAQTGDIAADHYHRMREDVALMAALGLRAYRFSIAWPRVIPAGSGPTNQRGLDFYDRLVDTLLEHGITPVPTLYHWDLPLESQDLGGWLTRQTAYAFADYAEVVARQLGDRVHQWITLNEPYVAAYLGHAMGIHAPGLRDPQAAAIAAHHLLLAHGLAVPRLRQASPAARVGITLDLSPVYGTDERPATLAAVARMDRLKNRCFLDPIFRGMYPEELFADQGVAPPPIQHGDLAAIAAPLDFLGVNYYSRTVVGSPQGETEIRDYVPVPGAAYTEMGWEVFPPGLTAILLRLQRDYAPRALVITENGAAFADHWDGGERIHDDERLQYLRGHIAALADAIRQGVPVTGYFAWSLLDNFEWGHGYSKRFGLVYVDYATQRRIVKDSGYWYRDLLAEAPH